MREDIKVISYNKILYKGICIKVSPEAIQDAHAGTIDINLLESYIKRMYRKSIQEIREEKINTILK